MRKTTLRKQPSEKATFISFSGHKGAEIIPLHGYSQGFR
nr:Aldehyde dehydrogenase [Escherichia coli]